MDSTLSIAAGQCSEKGVKAFNEDACGICVPKKSSALNAKGIAVVIADGVSSCEAGREASETCVQGFLNDYYSTSESWTVKTSGQKVLGALNRWLYGRSQTIYGSGQGMLTTFSAVVIKSATAHIFHVGDTRVYRYRDGALKCLTRDHQTWIDREKGFLSRAMGADHSVDIDYHSLPVEVGDRFLLTSDGVHEYVSKQDLADQLSAEFNNPERIARDIIALALKQGSQDNLTCQLFEVTELPTQSEEEFYRQLTELPFPPFLETGHILDGYKIMRELHASKRTQVYLAMDTETDEKVVIKTPSVNFEDDPQYIDGFLQEEWAGRRINNLHVLKVIEPTRRRRFLYYVTEHIEGQTLEQWINDHPLPDIQTVRPLVKQLVAGIRAFKRQEMIHQDLKPGNIMIDKYGTVKIIDFGSTKIAGIQEMNSPIQRGQLLGTLDYAAPEYFEGFPGTYRSDIYSLGVIVYEMFCGKLPYGRPLSARAIKRVRYIPARHINSNVPVWVDAALEKATQLNPKLRYATMSEFVTDLTRPNHDLIKRDQSLIERNPIALWRGLTVFLLVLNLVLLYILATR